MLGRARPIARPIARSIQHRTAPAVAKLSLSADVGWSFSSGRHAPPHQGRQRCLEDATKKEKVVAEQEVKHHREVGAVLHSSL